jgi:hypothetical protein
MNALTALAVIKGISKKAMPVIKAYACKSCGSIASVSIKGNAIKVTKCACLRSGI